MASSYKLIPSNKFTTVRNLVNESIPITGSLVSGTYASDGNIQNFSHGMFQSVFDYPYLSASANKLFDITCGFSANSGMSGATTHTTASRDAKINLYNEMAKVLMGYDITGSVLEFDEDGNIAGGGTKLRECIFISFSRLLQKDEIKKGTFAIELYPSGTFAQRGVASVSTLKFTDIHATSSYFTNSPAGEWSYLVTMTSSNGVPTTEKRGLIFYQAGIVVLTASIFGATTGFTSGSVARERTIVDTMTSSAISGTCDGFRRKLHNISFLNTTEVNSTVVFLDIGHDEFNYSSNPTYLSSSKMRVKTNADDMPVTYITTVGLYSPDNELLAVGKYSEPIRKTPADSYSLKARLDF
jgi:hypothetical protein